MKRTHDKASYTSHSPRAVARRQNPRLACTGSARIAPLPREGAVSSAKVLDLNLAGCCIETTQALEPGARAELLIGVNDCWLRAMDHLKAIRGRLAGAPFVQLTRAEQDRGCKPVARDTYAEKERAASKAAPPRICLVSVDIFA